MIDYSNWVEYVGSSEGSGRSEKIWLTSDKKEMGLFKFTKTIDTKENISEKIAEEIAGLIGLKCARIEIGLYKSRSGCMSYLINKEGEDLIEGIYFISGICPGYDPISLYDSESDQYYSLQMILKSLKDYKLSYEFLKIVIFDFLIGNSDRHQSNWAVLRKDETIRMCPLYDNGSSLCCYIEDKNIDLFLGKDKMKFNSLVDSKSRSRIRINGKIKREPTHLEVLKYVHSTYNNEQLNEWVKKIISVLIEEKIQNTINNFNDDLLSTKRKLLIIKFLSAKVKLLKEVFF